MHLQSDFHNDIFNTILNHFHQVIQTISIRAITDAQQQNLQNTLKEVVKH
jgi:hypothetical protein